LQKQLRSLSFSNTVPLAPHLAAKFRAVRFEEKAAPFDEGTSWKERLSLQSKG